MKTPTDFTSTLGALLMSILFRSRICLSLAFLAACGGGGDSDAAPRESAMSFAALYAPPQRYAVATLDGYTVNARYGSGARAYRRAVPLLIRHPLGTSGPLPLVLWSHGGALNDDGKYQNDAWGNALARAGYIVIHMSHSEAGRLEQALLAAEFGIAPRAMDRELAANLVRPRDAIATLNDLDGIEAAFPELRGRIDRERVGVGGHSRGAYTARTVACARIALPNDPDYSFLAVAPTNTPLKVQPKAFLANSPQGPGRFGFKDDSWRDCTRPDLTQTGDGDITPGELPADRIKPFELMPPGDKFRMFIADSNTSHATFNLRNDVHPQFVGYVRSTGLAFFDAYLRGLPEAQAWLRSGNLESASGRAATLASR